MKKLLVALAILLWAPVFVGQVEAQEAKHPPTICGYAYLKRGVPAPPGTVIYATRLSNCQVYQGQVLDENGYFIIYVCYGCDSEVFSVSFIPRNIKDVRTTPSSPCIRVYKSNIAVPCP